MFDNLKHSRYTAKLLKTRLYSRLRQHFPMSELTYLDDRHKIGDAEIVKIEWPVGFSKPRFGVVCDYGLYPRWTKYCRFLENNNFEFEIFNLHACDWIKDAQKFDIIVGFVSNEFWHLEEMREKYYFLNNFLGKATYPSVKHINMYENKKMEAYFCQENGLPYVNTNISHDKADALQIINDFTYPIISKIVPSSGSMGVELVKNKVDAGKIVKQAFSRNGRVTHKVDFRQKDYIYFQEFIPNDGYDIRVIVVGNWLFGYYRKVLEGDFRASGMNKVEKRELPEDAMRIALQLNQIIKSPILVVDMVFGQDGNFHIIEYSPICQMETPEQLHVKGVPGVYIFESDGSFRFKEGRYWVHELGLREFLIKDFIPRIEETS